MSADVTHGDLDELRRELERVRESVTTRLHDLGNDTHVLVDRLDERVAALEELVDGPSARRPAPPLPNAAEVIGRAARRLLATRRTHNAGESVIVDLEELEELDRVLDLCGITVDLDDFDPRGGVPAITPEEAERIAEEMSNTVRVGADPRSGYALDERGRPGRIELLEADVAGDGDVSYVELGAFTFADAQRYVGGDVEVVRVPDSRMRVLLVNEEGAIRGLAYNGLASRLAGRRIVGNVVHLVGRAAYDAVLGGGEE